MAVPMDINPSSNPRHRPNSRWRSAPRPQSSVPASSAFPYQGASFQPMYNAKSLQTQQWAHNISSLQFTSLDPRTYGQTGFIDPSTITLYDDLATRDLTFDTDSRPVTPPSPQIPSSGTAEQIYHYQYTVCAVSHAEPVQSSRSNKSLSTSPTDSYLDGFSTTASNDSWQYIDYHSNQTPSPPQPAFCDPAHTLYFQPSVEVKIEMRSHEEYPPGCIEHPYYRTDSQPVHVIDDYKLPSGSTTLYDQPSHVPMWASDDSDSGSSRSGSDSPPSTSLSGSPPTLQRMAMVEKQKQQRAAAKKVFGPVVALKKEKRKTGRRSGPLHPEQRKQASLIRSIGACIRCRCLKKTCDPGLPCVNCQPHHNRLWQTPCTRLDIKDLGFFLQEWELDFQQVTLPEFNITGFSGHERLLFIGHGFGLVLPVTAREVFVRDDKSLELNWFETHLPQSQQFFMETANYDLIGGETINKEMLSDYLDRHIDSGWSRFVDNHFEGTPFLSEMLKTAYTYSHKTKLPVIRTALKLVLAYNLTYHITTVEGSDEDDLCGKVDDPASKYHGKVVAPAMINYQIKVALSNIWRELHREVLKGLSSLIIGVHGAEKPQNLPSVFMVSFLLLVVWEQFQFDSIRRNSNLDEARKICQELNGVSVDVIIGLFRALSQKLPAFKDWDSARHHQIVDGNDNGTDAACVAMTEVKGHVIKHGEYLKRVSLLSTWLIMYIHRGIFACSRPPRLRRGRL
jgi:hypothetical protein